MQPIFCQGENFNIIFWIIQIQNCVSKNFQLNVEELQTRYEEEKKKLTDVREKMVAETSRIDALTEGWETILKEMQPAIEEILTMGKIFVKYV